MISTIVFAVSGAGVVLFLGLKNWEQKRPARVLERHRRALDDKVVVLARRVCVDAPRATRVLALHASHGTLHYVAQTAVAATRATEKRLSRVADTIRGRHHEVVKSQRPSSDFLHTVAQHKNGLRNGMSKGDVCDIEEGVADIADKRE